jgi:hypothetical protein
MKNFDIYPKEGGEKFTLLFESFEAQANGFFLRDDTRLVYPLVYLSMDNVAAILPAEPRRYNAKKELEPYTFHVYLKRRIDPLVIPAYSFDASAPPSVIFNWERKTSADPFTPEEFPLQDIYIALSEVVAIMPKGGLIPRE